MESCWFKVKQRSSCHNNAKQGAISQVNVINYYLLLVETVT